MKSEREREIEIALKLLNRPQDMPLIRGQVFQVKWAVDKATEYGLKQDDKGVWYEPLPS